LVENRLDTGYFEVKVTETFELSQQGKMATFIRVVCMLYFLQGLIPVQYDISVLKQDTNDQ